MQSTMVTGPGRQFLPSLHVPAQAPIFFGDINDPFGWVASATVKKRPVAELSVAPLSAAMQSVTMQSVRAFEGRSQIFNAGVTSAYGHVVNGFFFSGTVK